jgi:hypothetical protein
MRMSLSISHLALEPVHGIQGLVGAVESIVGALAFVLSDRAREQAAEKSCDQTDCDDERHRSRRAWSTSRHVVGQIVDIDIPRLTSPALVQLPRTLPGLIDHSRNDPRDNEHDADSSTHRQRNNPLVHGIPLSTGCQPTYTAILLRGLA